MSKKDIEAIDNALATMANKLRVQLNAVKHPLGEALDVVDAELEKMSKKIEELSKAIASHSDSSPSDTILETEIQDWRIGQGAEDVPPEDAKKYKLSVKFDKTTGQLYVDIDNGEYMGMSLFVEINEGKPCVHVSNDLGGDNILHMFGVDEGIVVTPEKSDKPEQAAKDRYSYNSNQGLLYRGTVGE